MTKIALILRGVEPSTFFVFIGILFGALLILITPPLQGPDEQAHFIQAYRVSEGKIGLSLTSAAQDDMLPKSISETYKVIFYGQNDIRFDGNRKYSLGETKQTLGIPLNQGDKIKSGLISGTGYSAVSYAPQAVMIAIGRLFNFPPIVLIYLGRIGGLLAWVAIVYIALRLLPIAKWGAAVVALVPMSLFQASVISADTIPLALLGLYIALILRCCLISPRTLTAQQVILLTVVASLMSLGKQIMAVFIPLVLLQVLGSNERVHSVRARVHTITKILIIIVIPVTIAAVWTLLAGASGGSSVTENTQMVNPSTQLHHLLVHPTEFLFALWNTNFYAWGDGVTRSIIGTFGWADTPMALSFTIAGFFMLAIAMLGNRGQDYKILPWLTNIRSRGLIIVLLLGYFIATSLAMYIYYSPVDFNIIVGLQGRYFLPLLLVILLLTVNRDQVTLKPNTYVFFSRLLPIGMLIVSCVYVVIRYYLPTRI